jgi:hypothetical protein
MVISVIPSERSESRNVQWRPCAILAFDLAGDAVRLSPWDGLLLAAQIVTDDREGAEEQRTHGGEGFYGKSQLRLKAVAREAPETRLRNSLRLRAFAVFSSDPGARQSFFARRGRSADVSTGFARSE